MTNVLLIVFTITLVYLSIANRIRTYIHILSLQGIILFGISLISLTEISSINLIFILLENLGLKAISIPLFLVYIIKKNRITREAEPYVPNFVSLVIVSCIIIVTFLISSSIGNPDPDKMYFIVALSSLFTGLYIILTRRKVITHVMGYLIIENGVFILSLAVGTEIPMLINTAILLDLIVSILLLGLFVNKIGDIFKDADIDQLSQLKD